MSGFARPLKKREASGPTPAPAGSFSRRPSFGFAQPAATADAPQPWSFLKPQWHSPSPGWHSPVQAKLVVGKVDDPLEQEADRVAEAVLRPPTAAPPDARPPAPPGGPPPGSPGLPASTAGRPASVQRKCAACDGSGTAPCDACSKPDDGAHEHSGQASQSTSPTVSTPSDPAEIQRHGEGAPSITPGVAEAVGAMGGGGDPLPSVERRFFEARLGHDLSQVRVHADRAAHGAARALDADAFTLRNDVAFAEGRYQPSSETGRRLLAHELVHVIQQGHATPLAGAGASPVQGGRGAARIARQAAGERETSPGPAQVPSPSPEIPQTTASGGGLIVEDDAQTLMAGQVRKSELLSELRAASCAAADRELARAGRDTRGCPFVEKWLDHYKDRPAQHLERAIRKYATGAAAARSAHDYVPLVAARMAQGVATWVATGRLPGDIPDEMKSELPGGGGVGSAIAGAFSSVAGAIGGALSAIGHLFFKEAPGGARTGADAAGLTARLGPGRPLESTARSRMEGAFGRSFDGVRVHDDEQAGKLAVELNAHAFTLGKHVAFERGRYQPGTPVGDAILAHELAHVEQQEGAAAPAPEVAHQAPPDAAVEDDADRAAAGAMTFLYAPGTPPANRRPRLRGELRLSRCAASAPAAKTPAQQASATGTPSNGEADATRQQPQEMHPAGETTGDLKLRQNEGIALDATETSKLQGGSYWQQKVRGALADSTTNEATSRLQSGEEREAVYAVLWDSYQKLKKPIASRVVDVVSVPARGAGTKALSYRFTFEPPAPATSGQAPDQRTRVMIEFELEGAGATLVTAPTPSSPPPARRFSAAGYPDTSDTYFEKYPDEQAQILAFIDTGTFGPSGQLVTTSTKRRGTVTHASTFKVSGEKSGTTVKDLEVDLLAQSAAATDAPPEGYASRDRADLELEEPGKDKQRLGQVRLPAGLPQDEIIPVKDAVYQYFQIGTRGAEVDAIVPTTSGKRVLYTLKFHARSNDVDVVRVGEAGKVGQVDEAKVTFDLARIPDYASNATDPGKLSGWIKKRYPAISPTGSTVAALKSSAEAQITEAAVKEDWFENNYGMPELGASAAESRLMSVHHWDPRQTAEFKTFLSSERKTIELALESLSDPLLPLLRGIPIARQKVFIEKSGSGKSATYTERPKMGGRTVTWTTTGGKKVTSTQRTIIFFDSMTINDATLFAGAPGRVEPESVETPIHEFGHAIGEQAGIQGAFNKKFEASKAKLRAAPITAYAGTNPEIEFFPEAFALYNADPTWMKENLREMFDWFQTLSKTGTAPP